MPVSISSRFAAFRPAGFFAAFFFAVFFFAASLRCPSTWGEPSDGLCLRMPPHEIGGDSRRQGTLATCTRGKRVFPRSVPRTHWRNAKNLPAVKKRRASRKGRNASRAVVARIMHHESQLQSTDLDGSAKGTPPKTRRLCRGQPLASAFVQQRLHLTFDWVEAVSRY